MRLPLTSGYGIRSWQEGDAQNLVIHANHLNIWRNLRDGFPHPYGLKDAQAFLKKARDMSPECFFCIAHQDQAIGSIGFSLKTDVERFSAELGYWLSEQHWGAGVMTQAVTAITNYAVLNHSLVRVFAMPYHTNPASHRVLEKAGYRQEARLRKSSFKEGRFVDQLLYAFVV